MASIKIMKHKMAYCKAARSSFKKTKSRGKKIKDKEKILKKKDGR